MPARARSLLTALLYSSPFFLISATLDVAFPMFLFSADKHKQKQSPPCPLLAQLARWFLCPAFSCCAMNSRLDRGAERCAPLAASEGRGCLLIDSNLNVSPSLFGFGLGFLRRRHDLEQIYIVGTTFLLSSEPLPSLASIAVLLPLLSARQKMVGLASLAAIARVAVQWSCSVLVLLVVGAFLAEASPPSASGARAVNSPVEDDSQHNSSAGKRCDLSVVCAALH